MSQENNIANDNSKYNKKYKFKKKKRSLKDSLKQNDTSISPQEDETNIKESKKNKNLPHQLTGNDPWQIKMQKAILENKLIHEKRL